jgi:hypothetical protein
LQTTSALSQLSQSIPNLAPMPSQHHPLSQLSHSIPNLAPSFAASVYFTPTLSQLSHSIPNLAPMPSQHHPLSQLSHPSKTTSRLHEPFQIHNEPFVLTIADLLLFIVRLHLK